MILQTTGHEVHATAVPIIAGLRLSGRHRELLRELLADCDPDERAEVLAAVAAVKPIRRPDDA